MEELAAVLQKGYTVKASYDKKVGIYRIQLINKIGASIHAEVDSLTQVGEWLDEINHLL